MLWRAWLCQTRRLSVCLWLVTCVILSCRSRVNSLHSTRYNMDKSHKLQHCKICVSCRISCGRVAARHLWQGCDSPHCASKVIAQSPHAGKGTAEVCPMEAKAKPSCKAPPMRVPPSTPPACPPRGSVGHGNPKIKPSCMSVARYRLPAERPADTFVPPEPDWPPPQHLLHGAASGSGEQA